MELNFDTLSPELKALMIEALTYFYKGVNGVDPKPEDVSLVPELLTVRLTEKPACLDISFSSKHYNIFTGRSIYTNWTITETRHSTPITVEELTMLLDQACRPIEEIHAFQLTLEKIVMEVYSMKTDLFLNQFKVVN